MLKQGLSHKLLQKLSPQQIQFVQLLQLNTTELEKRVEEEITENPALESEAADVDGKDAADTLDENYEGAEEDFSGEEKEEGPDDSFQEDLNDYMVGDDEDEYSSYQDSDPNEEYKELPFAQGNTLYDTLRDQLYSQRMTEREKELGRHLIGMLEEDGYLRRPLKNIAYDLAFLNQIETDEKELEAVLRIIQNFDPPGIGARSLEECLLLQLNRKDQKNENVKIAKRMVKDYMEDLAKKHYEKLMKSLKIDRDKLKDVIELITHLDPKPGESQVNVKTQYIIPDFIVSSEDGDISVTLNSRNAPELRVSRSYQETLRGYKEDAKNAQLKKQVQFIKQKLDGAKWFIEAIKQRQNTLLQTMKSIVEFQKEFFLSGDIEKLQPMILKDIADKIMMDISTVSRVANSKYVQTDFGIYPLKEFFSEGIQTDSGEEVSNKEVKSILSEMIGKESKKRPLTDEKLTDLLNERGYNIARRTVAKYREQLGIQVARLRKEI
jgi:RNA polymerase sigma-54 factor